MNQAIAGVSFLFPDAAAHDATAIGATAAKRDTKRIGDYSEMMVMAVLARNGFLVSIPVGENHRYDLLADDGTRIYRVQVKTGRLRYGTDRSTSAVAVPTAIDAGT